MSSELSGLFSDLVIVRSTRADHIDDSRLWPAEAAALGEVVEGRRWDYVSGRRCARDAIEALGVEAEPILSGDRREPLWPDGVVGAITHTTGFAAAVVAHGHDRRGIGLDAEPDAPLPPNVITRVGFDHERSWASSGASSGVANPDRLLFCAKEAIYKVWFPIAKTWLGFEDARVTFEPATQTFDAEILVNGPITSLHGRYDVVDGIVLAGIEFDG